MCVEQLAALEHERWSGWMNYMFSKNPPNEDGTWTMPVWAVERWQRQANTPYAELSEEEKESDRVEVRKTLVLLTSAPSRPNTGEAVARLEHWLILREQNGPNPPTDWREALQSPSPAKAKPGGKITDPVRCEECPILSRIVDDEPICAHLPKGSVHCHCMLWRYFTN